MWNKESLQQLVKEKLSDYLFVVVSNREPYIHNYTTQRIECIMPASGLTVALDPVMRSCGGIWVAHGNGTADKDVTDDNNCVSVPPDAPSYKLKRVWLTEEEVDRYYMGFSNETLWPLCHIVYQRPAFNAEDWHAYKRVNQLFADAVLDAVKDRKALIFIQDYHLTLLSRLIRAKNNRVITAQFWHIPWPNREAFRICPWQNEILDGLLGNDLLGFHISYHRDNFIQTVDRALECKVDYENYSISRGNHVTYVMPFPISVDFEAISGDAQTDEVNREIINLMNIYKLADKIIGIGIDRIDYTKGIPERLKAIDLLLSIYPEYKYEKRLVFFQIAEPSRIKIARYRELNREIEELVNEINDKHRVDDWEPIIFIKEHKSPTMLLALRKMADFCIVSSLHDGMNLVAKEFVSSRYDEDGVLILSMFTGAARELTEALLINPYDIHGMADSIRAALKLPAEIRRKKVVSMRNKVRNNNIYKWAADIIDELVRIESA